MPHVEGDAMRARTLFAITIGPLSTKADDVATFVWMQSDANPLLLTARPFCNLNWLT